ncbi:MAG: TIR domain-containing protein [Hyphomicrobium sp.]
MAEAATNPSIETAPEIGERGHRTAVNLRVFVSYSRTDSLDFADQLVPALQTCGFEAIIDRHGILGAEDWKKRLGVLIEGADTIVFVLSPESADSPICAWEVDEAARLSKRIIPIVAIPLSGKTPPPRLADLNYIFFCADPAVRDGGFGTGLSRLVDALNTDLDWVREHTRLLARATEWESAGRVENRMLSGIDIGAAKGWAARRPKGAPEPTALHLDYIKASEAREEKQQNEERKRLSEREGLLRQAESVQAEREAASRILSRRTTVGLVGAGGLTMLSAGLAYWGTNAESRFRKERARATTAAKASLEAAIEKDAARPDIQGVLTVFALEPDLDTAGDTTPRLGRTLLSRLKDKDNSVERALRIARDEVLRSTHNPNAQRPFIVTDLNAEIYLTRNPPTRRRSAVVIGNSDYQFNSKLRFPAADAQAWSAFLVEQAFDVVSMVDVNRLELVNGIENVLAKMSLKEEGQTKFSSLFVLFYAGHGISIQGVNYIVPIDAKLESAEQAPRELISIDEVTSRSRAPGVASLVILNAQRSMPVAFSR